MGRNTHISEALEIADAKAKYDAEVKKILSDRDILAWILKYTTKEFLPFTIDQIKDCIEGEPEISSVPVSPGRRPGRITGINTEDNVPKEGLVTYDIRFTVLTPGKERIKLIVNLEAQKKFYPGYDVVTRCIFYLARQLSAQMDTEFTADNYDDIKKVYSIWICMDSPKKAANTITKYDIQQTPIAGNFQGTARYDLMAGIMVCLGREIHQEKGSLLQLLGTLLSDGLTAAEKEEILERDYGIETSLPAKEVLNTMCNLSDLIEEKAEAKGLEKGIEKGMEKGLQQGRTDLVIRMYENGLPVEQISEIAQLSVDEIEELLKTGRSHKE